MSDIIVNRFNPANRKAIYTFTEKMFPEWKYEMTGYEPLEGDWKAGDRGILIHMKNGMSIEAKAARIVEEDKNAYCLVAMLNPNPEAIKTSVQLDEKRIAIIKPPKKYNDIYDAFCVIYSDLHKKKKIDSWEKFCWVSATKQIDIRLKNGIHLLVSAVKAEGGFTKMQVEVLPSTETLNGDYEVTHREKK